MLDRKKTYICKNPKAKYENLAKDPHVNVSGIAAQNYESINID